MKLESDETIQCVSAEKFIKKEKNELPIDILPEKRRRSSRQNAKQKSNDDSKCGCFIERSNTPTELIKDMTSFTFSNYFTPISKDSTPLPKLNWADSNDVWENMLQKDREYKRDPLYIRKHPSLQPRMRAVLLDWLIEVIIASFKFYIYMANMILLTLVQLHCRRVNVVR